MAFPDRGFESIAAFAQAYFDRLGRAGESLDGASLDAAAAALADVNLHAEADNYGVVEDIHQSLMHILAQFLRLKRMDAGLIAERRF